MLEGIRSTIAKTEELATLLAEEECRKKDMLSYNCIITH